MTIRTNNLPIAVTATTAAVVGGLSVAAVYWYQPIKLTRDSVTLQDSDGNLIWQGYCEVANQSEVFRFPQPITVPGYKVPTLGSGTLYIYRC